MVMEKQIPKRKERRKFFAGGCSFVPQQVADKTTPVRRLLFK
jgi:hypothetical protein